MIIDIALGFALVFIFIPGVLLALGFSIYLVDRYDTFCRSFWAKTDIPYDRYDDSDYADELLNKKK